MGDEEAKRNIEDTKQQPLLLKSPQMEKTYQNLEALTLKLTLLCLSSFYYGYALVYYSTFPAEVALEVYGDMTNLSWMNGLIIGVLPIGSIVGSVTTPFLMKIFSRRQIILLINTLAIVVEGILQINNIYVLLVCRIFQGVFIGYYMALVPVYVYELVPKQIKGSFGVFTQLLYVFGTLFCYILSIILTSIDVDSFVFFRIMVSFNVVLIIIQTIFLLSGYIPDSPISLIKQNRHQEAKEVIGMFTIPEYVEEVYKQKLFEFEFETQKRKQEQKQNDKQIESKAQLESDESRVKEQKIIYSYKAYLLGFELPLMMQMTGINAISTQINSLAAYIIPSIQNYISMIVIGAQLIATVGAIAVLRKFGRRSLSLLGTGAIAVIDLAIGVFYIYNDWVASGYIILILLMLYMVVIGLTIGPVIRFYMPEILPAKMVPHAMLMSWGGCAFCVILTPIVIDANNGNPYPAFLFFGGFIAVCFAVNWILMVETKGLNTRSIAKLFHTKN